MCSVSTRHYAFTVYAFVNLISSLNTNEYEFTLREIKTSKIIEDVACFHSEVGVLYFSDFNKKVLKKLLKGKVITRNKINTTIMLFSPVDIS